LASSAGDQNDHSLPKHSKVNDQGCALVAPGRLRRPPFGFGRLTKIVGRPAGHSTARSPMCSKDGKKFLHMVLVNDLLTLTKA